MLKNFTLCTLVITAGERQIFRRSGAGVPAERRESASRTGNPPPLPKLSAPLDDSWKVVSAADRTEFLAALDKVDTRLTENDERALSVAATICFQVYDKKATDVVRAATQKEYANVVAKISPEKADEILTAVKKWICSSHGLYVHSLT